MKQICSLCNDSGCDDCMMLREAIDDYIGRIRAWEKTGNWRQERYSIREVPYRQPEITGKVCPDCNREFHTEKGMKFHIIHRTEKSCRHKKGVLK
jgi:hypothetical protein